MSTNKEIIYAEAIPNMEQHMEEFNSKTRWVISYGDLLSSIVTTVIHHRLNNDVYNLDSYNGLCLTLKTCISSTFPYLENHFEDVEDKINRVANVLAIKLAFGKFDLSILKEIMRIIKAMLLTHIVNNIFVHMSMDEFISGFSNEENIIEHVMYKYNMFYKMENDVFFTLDTLDIDADEVITNINTLAGIIDNEQNYFIDNDKIDEDTFFIEILHRDNLSKFIKLFRLTILRETEIPSYHIEEISISENMLTLINNMRNKK